MTIPATAPGWKKIYEDRSLPAGEVFIVALDSSNLSSTGHWPELTSGRDAVFIVVLTRVKKNQYICIANEMMITLELSWNTDPKAKILSLYVFQNSSLPRAKRFYAWNVFCE